MYLTDWKVGQDKPAPTLSIYNDDIVECNGQFYDSVAALIRDLIEYPENYGIRGEVYEVQRGGNIDPENPSGQRFRMDSDIRVFWHMTECSCTVDENENTIKDKCDCGEWYEDFNYNHKNIVRLVR